MNPSVNTAMAIRRSTIPDVAVGAVFIFNVFSRAGYAEEAEAAGDKAAESTTDVFAKEKKTDAAAINKALSNPAFSLASLSNKFEY